MSSLLAKFEAFMEQIIEASVARFFKSPLDTATLSRRLERTMEANQTIEGNRIRVPHTYYTYLNPAEYTSYRQRHARIERELTQYLFQLAQSRGFYTSQNLAVFLRSDAAVQPASIRIDVDMTISGASDVTAGAPVVGGGTVDLDEHRRTVIHTAPEQYNPQARYVIEVHINDTTQIIPIKTTEVTVGRGPGNNIILPDHQVSRNHARIHYGSRHFRITDLASRNGTYVNDRRIVNDTVSLDDNTVIVIGSYTIKVRKYTHE